MRILIVMGGFFPGKEYGGPPVSVDNFCTLMSEDECYIVTRNHDLSDTIRYSEISEGWNDRGNCKVLYLSDSQYNKQSFDKVITEVKPDILYLQGLFQSCVFPCLQLAKENDINVLLAPRGELCAGALALKKYKKIPYIKVVNLLGLTKNIHFQSTSDEETTAIKRWMNADDEHIHYLDNIPSIPITAYPRSYKEVGVGRFVFLSRIHPKKNLLSAINYFYDVHGRVYFDIFGPIEDDLYWRECQSAIASLPDNITVEYKGVADHTHVHEIFSQYDAFLFPTLSENYGHVIAESLIAGTPVIISDQTPWNKVNSYNAGWAIPLVYTNDFIEAIQAIINYDDITMKELSSNIKALIDSLYDCCAYKNSYNNALNRIK